VGQTGRHLQIHGRRVRRLRHLDLGANRCVIECELRRLLCPDCRVRYQAVPWARGLGLHRDEWNAHDRSRTTTGKRIKGTRWSLLKSPDKQTIPQLALLGEVAHANHAMFRAFLLKEELRLLYALENPALALAHLDAWLAWASTSRLAPFIRLARTIRRHHAGILAAIRLGLLQRTPGGPQQPHPTHQPPQLRLPLRRTPSSPSPTSAAR
jgi:transposase